MNQITTESTCRSRRLYGFRGYGKIFIISLREQLAYLPGFLLKNIFFIMIIAIFYALWRVVFSGQPVIAGFSMVQTLWYLTFTETIVLSLTRVWYDIQQEVRDGTLAYLMIRPHSYVAFKFCRSMGESLLRMITLLLEGFLLAYLLAGHLPGYLTALTAGLLLIILGIAMNTWFFIMIGLLAFWTEETSPFFMIYQKILFIFGGMFIPLEFFPEWLRGITIHTPFAYAVYWPARIMVGYSPSLFLQALAGQVAWIAGTVTGVFLLFRAAGKRLHIQGG